MSTWDCYPISIMGARGLQLQGKRLLIILVGCQNASGKAHLLDDQEHHASQIGILALVQLGDAEEHIGGLFLRPRPVGSAEIHLASACHMLCLEVARAEEGSSFSHEANSLSLCQHPWVHTFVKVSP